MAFFGSRRPVEKARAGGTKARPAARSIGPLDTLARVLRILGKHSFDTAQTPAKRFAATAERWATHTLTGLPADPTAASGGESAGGGARRLGELASWLEAHRSAEVATVSRQRKDLKRVVSECAKAFRRILGAEASTNSEIDAALSGLERASVATAKDLPAQVIQAVGEIRASMSARDAQLDTTLKGLTDQLETVQASLKVARRRAQTDALTGLANRGTFDNALAELVERTGQQSACLMLIDLDHFKQINDTWGHPGGDETLRQVGCCLTRAFPRRGDLIARYGGEEFVVLLEGVDQVSACKLADRLIQIIRALAVDFDGRQIFVTASVGCTLLRPNDSAESFVKRADTAMYQAKATGRDGVVHL